MVPGLSLLLAPLTLVAGPVTSYNVAAVLMPSLAAWTAFLLCRHLTGRLWPSLIGGYLFGFSSYMLGQELGHMQMTSAFLVPLVALIVLLYLEQAIGGWGLVLRLGPLLALQLLFATEVEFTLTLALACALLIGFAVAPAYRHQLISSLVPLAGAYLLAGVLCSPFIYYLLAGLHTEAFHNPQDYNTDPVNFVIPTQVSLVGHDWARPISMRFPGNISERGAYIGVPALLIVALYSWERRRTAGGRFLTLSFVASVLAALGFNLIVHGHRLVELPWAHIGYRALFNNVLPDRLSMYIALIVAVIVSIWAASPGGAVRWLLPLLALASILPYPSPAIWSTAYELPPFVTNARYRDCLTSGEMVLPLPPNRNGDADIWQAADGFRFRMTGGYVATEPPTSFLSSPAARLIAAGGAVPADHANTLREFIREKNVTSIVVDLRQTRYWEAALNRIAKPHKVGGVLLYYITDPARRCPSN
jgi:hypothetical protein